MRSSPLPHPILSKEQRLMLISLPAEESVEDARVMQRRLQRHSSDPRRRWHRLRPGTTKRAGHPAGKTSCAGVSKPIPASSYISTFQSESTHRGCDGVVSRRRKGGQRSSPLAAETQGGATTVLFGRHFIDCFHFSTRLIKVELR